MLTDPLRAASGAPPGILHRESKHLASQSLRIPFVQFYYFSSASSQSQCPSLLHLPPPASSLSLWSSCTAMAVELYDSCPQSFKCLMGWPHGHSLQGLLFLFFTSALSEHHADTVDLDGDFSPLRMAPFLLSPGVWPKVGPLALGYPREIGALFCSLSYPWATDEDTSPLDKQHLPLELQAFGTNKSGSYSIQEASEAMAWHFFPASVPLLVFPAFSTHTDHLWT